MYIYFYEAGDWLLRFFFDKNRNIPLFLSLPSFPTLLPLPLLALLSDETECASLSLELSADIRDAAPPSCGIETGRWGIPSKRF